MRKLLQRKRKRIIRFKAENGDYIAIYLWKESPNEVPKDIIELEIHNKKPVTYYMRPDEASEIAAGLFLALNDYYCDLEDKYEEVEPLEPNIR